jgi:hypothetical protein
MFRFGLKNTLIIESLQHAQSTTSDIKLVQNFVLNGILLFEKIKDKFKLLLNGIKLSSAISLVD